MPDIRHIAIIKTNPRRVYAALTQTTHVSRWWAQAAVDPAAGGQVKVQFPDRTGQATFVIQTLAPGQLIEWRCIDANVHDTAEWVGTLVRFELAFVGNWGTEVTLVHEGFAAATACHEATARDWADAICSRLKAYLETGPPDGALSPARGSQPR